MFGYEKRRETPFWGRTAYGWFRPRGLGQALRCWRTQDGGTVCSNMLYYAPNCPTAPPVTEAQTAATPPEAAAAS